MLSYRVYSTVMSNGQTVNEEKGDRKSVWLRRVADVVLCKHTIFFPLLKKL